MGRPKKVDYAAMFSYDSKAGLYYCSRSINGVKKKFRAKDPKELYDKVEAAVNAPPVIPTFREIAEQWQDQKWETIQDNTRVGYTSSYKRAVDQLGDRPIDAIIPADINRIILQMKAQGYAAKTVKAQKSILKMIFDFAITQEDAWITFNPVSAITIPRGLPKKKRSAPDDDVMQIIIDNVDTATFGLFPYLLIYTGCRRGEALALTWGDIDFEENEVSISKEYAYPYGMPILKTPKTEAGFRTVPLLPGLKQHLVRPPKAKDDTLLFPSPDGRPLQENAFRRRWRHYCKDVGLVTDVPEKRVSKQNREYIYHNIKPTITPHQLRHGYATLLHESDIDAKTAQSLLGHADIHTTLQIYTDIRDGHRKAQADKLTGYMAKKYGESDSREDTKPASD